MYTGFDFYKLDSQLSEEQRHLRNQVQTYVEHHVHPYINPYWERAEFPYEIVMGLKDLRIMGGALKGYGCAGLDSLAMGLVACELARRDGSVCTFYIVHSGLAMGSIGLLGSEEQRERWLPKMALLEKIGGFGLTEPERGSDGSHVLTSARREGKNYILNGAKCWIGNASIADLIIIWARDEEGGFGGFVLENPREVEGVKIEDITGKITMRAVPTSHITLENVRIPDANRLAGSHSCRDTARVLTYNRYAVVWEALGLAAAAFERALKYTKEREQFGRPLAGFQLIEEKLVEMAAELTQMQLLCFQLARLMATDQMSEGMVSLAKYNNARKARHIVQLAREAMGASGVLLENHVARFFTDAEAIYTYEGTNEINMLIAGREITGINAIV